MMHTITIPALDELAARPPIRRVPWSEHDREIVRRYYGRGAVTCDALRAQFDHPDRTDNAIQVEAARLGATRGR